MNIKNLLNKINKLYHIFYDGNTFEATSVTGIKECEHLVKKIKNNPKQNYSQEINKILSYLKQTNAALNKTSTDNKGLEFAKTKQHAQDIINKILNNK